MSSSTSQTELTECDREPIHLLGGIQPHGVLLAFSEPELTQRVVSANTEALLGLAPPALLGRPLAELLHPTSLALLNRALSQQGSAGTLRIEAAGRSFVGLLHRSDGLAVLDLEPVIGDSSEDGALAMVDQVLSPLTRAKGPRALLQEVAGAVRALSGFDRVMVYLFDADWHGEVVAESRDPEVDTFLGLHFPASDIPVQARALYVRSTLRLIADARAAPVPLVPAVLPSLGRPLDLSGAALRSVSPVHLEYLANMGVGASMSISLLREGALWGLIACHHRTPLRVPAAARRACDVLARLVALQLASEERAATAAELARRAEFQVRLVERLSEDAGSLPASLARQADLMLGLTGATGAALLLGETPVLMGATPTQDEVKALCDWLVGQSFEGNTFHTERLGQLFPPAETYPDVASGLLAVRLDPSAPRFILWFRPEVVRTVTWAGNPRKPVIQGPANHRLHPRASFEAWQETLRGASHPWTTEDLTAAAGLRGALVGVLLRHAAALSRSNAELDAFGGMVAHDLKEPLRGIQQYVSFLLEDVGDAVGSEGRKQLEEVRWLAGRTQGQMEALFEYSRVGRVELSWGPADMQELLDEVLSTVSARLRENQVEVRIPRRLPLVACDRVRIHQVWSNLLTNAAKYHQPEPPRWVEVGFIAPQEPLSNPARRRADEYVFYVRDNGIGIPERFHETIFEMFRRLHPAHSFGGGSGAGLSIARRLIQLHGGDLWVESAPGEGSTFFFTLGKGPG
jgi:chemotaxis family two-component system sensor kinase Cph1